MSSISAELVQNSVTNPFIITDKIIFEIGLLDKLLAELDRGGLKKFQIFKETPPDSSLDLIESLQEDYFAAGNDGIIALGGGSVIDTAKALSVVTTSKKGKLIDYEGSDRINHDPTKTFIIPTTAGTGSEVTKVAVIQDLENRRKLAFSSPKLLPSVAFIDPQFTTSMPPALTATTGFDALTHAIEAFTSAQKNILSDMFALTSIRLIDKHLIAALKNPNDQTHRHAMAEAALLAGIAFSNSMVGIVHSISHSLGAISHLPHGLANAIVLPEGVKYNADSCEHLYEEILSHIKKPGNLYEYLVGLQESISQVHRIDWNLKAHQVRKEDFSAIAQEAVLDGSSIFNLKKFNQENVIDILGKLYE